MKWLTKAGHLCFVDGHHWPLPCEIGQTSSTRLVRLHCVIFCTRKVDLCSLDLGNMALETLSRSSARGDIILFRWKKTLSTRTSKPRQMSMHGPTCAQWPRNFPIQARFRRSCFWRHCLGMSVLGNLRAALRPGQWSFCGVLIQPFHISFVAYLSRPHGTAIDGGKISAEWMTKA